MQINFNYGNNIITAFAEKKCNDDIVNYEINISDQAVSKYLPNYFNILFYRKQKKFTWKIEGHYSNTEHNIKSTVCDHITFIENY